MSSSGKDELDVDDFDPFCEHLIVREPQNGQVIGTYRLLLGTNAKRHIGFYSEREFDLQNVKKLRGEMLELGRTCVHNAYRDKGVINMMWQAIADFVKIYQVQYLFGCASLYTEDPREVGMIFSFLKEKYYSSASLRVHPLQEESFPQLTWNVEIKDPKAMFCKLPSLIKGYLRLGAQICGPPAMDLEFGTTDFFLLLDIKRMSREYQRRFGFSGQKVGCEVG